MLKMTALFLTFYTALFECSKAAKHSNNYFGVSITFRHYVIDYF